MMVDHRFCTLKLWFLTGVRCMNIETERAWHARQLISELTLHELNSYDGIVAVSHAACCLILVLHAITLHAILQQHASHVQDSFLGEEWCMLSHLKLL
jgi:altronate dehydratase